MPKCYTTTLNPQTAQQKNGGTKTKRFCAAHVIYPDALFRQHAFGEYFKRALNLRGAMWRLAKAITEFVQKSAALADGIAADAERANDTPAEPNRRRPVARPRHISASQLAEYERCVRKIDVLRRQHAILLTTVLDLGVSIELSTSQLDVTSEYLCVNREGDLCIRNCAIKGLTTDSEEPWAVLSPAHLSLGQAVRSGIQPIGKRMPRRWRIRVHDPDRDAAFNPKISSRPKEVTVLPRMFPDGPAAIMPPAIPAHKMIAQVQQLQASEATETHYNRARDDMAETDHRYQHKAERAQRKAERAQRTEKGDDAVCRYCNIEFRDQVGAVLHQLL